jgi:hypothetical protein
MLHASAARAARKIVAAIHGIIPSVGSVAQVACGRMAGGSALAGSAQAGSALAGSVLAESVLTPAIFEPLETRRLMSVNVTTYHYNNAETGANTNETTLTLNNVNTSDFGKIASMNVSGQIYGQPLIMTGVSMANGEGTHDIVLVTTETDLVYAFDAYGNNPAQGYLWKTSLLQAGETPVPESDYGTTDITPSLGITGTPVINPATGTMYVVGLFKENNATYQQRIYALNISSGANAIAPVVIAASVSGSTYNTATYVNTGGVVTFSAFRENQRPALTLANGEVYVGWSSHGDQDPWHGWVMGYNAATLHQDYVYCNTADGEQGGIWMSGGGIAVDANGNLYFTTGNGTFDANTNTTADGDYGMTLEEVSPSLTEEQYFAPYNQATLSNVDLDYGCSNVILLTDQAGAYPNEVLSAGKWGTIYLNNVASLGGYNSNGTGPNNDLGEATLAGANTGTSNVHNTMVYWNGSVYLGGDALTLQAFSVANGVLGTTPTSQTSHVFGVSSAEDGQGAGLTVSSNGNSNGIVWALDNTGFLQSSAVLYAYNASNLAQTPLWSSSGAANNRDAAGVAIKFQDPVVANGHVYVAGDGSLTVYGLLNASANAPTVTAAASASPSPVTGTTTTLAVAASDPAGDLTPNYTWAAATVPTGAATPTFSINGTNNANDTVATFYKAGSYTFTATIEDPNSGLTTTSSVTITVNQTLTGITITPATTAVVDANTQQFSASANDQFGIAMATQPTFSWSVNAGGVGGTVSSTGLYTAPSSGIGTDIVTATAGSTSVSATVTVAIPSSTYQLSLTSYFNHFGIASTGSHSIPAPGIDNDQDGLADALLGTSQTWNGSSFIIGPTTTANNTFNVVDGTGQTITLTPGRYTAIKLLALHWDGSATESFTLNYSDGSTQTLTQSFSDWFAPQNFAGESEAVSMSYRIIANGRNGTGPYYLYGYVFTPDYFKTLDSITLPSDVQLDIIAMDTVGTLVPTVTTAASAIPIAVSGTSTALSVGGTDPSGDAKATFTWVATNMPSGAVTPTFSTNGTATSNFSTATFHMAGAYTFTVYITDPTTQFNVSSSVNVMVNQTLTNIIEIPPTKRLYDGGSTQFSASAYDQFGNPMASQPAFNWSVKPGGVGGTVNASTGTYTAPATGTGTDILNASSGTITGIATITVASPYPVLGSAATVTPSPVTGVTAVLTARATDTSGDAQPVYTWATTNMPSGAMTPLLSPDGTGASNISTATFYKAGAYTFTVTISDPTSGDSITSSVNVTVEQTITTVSVSPAGPVTVYNGKTQLFSATASDQFGQPIASPAFTWTILNSGPGSISTSGSYTAPASGSGSATIQATSAGVSGTASVNISPPVWLGAGSAATWNSSTGVLTVTGATTIVADPGNDQPVIQANGSSAAVTLNPATALQVHIGGLSLTNGATAILPSLGAARTPTNHRLLVLGLAGTLTAPLLNIDSTSQLDLADNDLVDHDGNISAVTALLRTGYDSAGAYWQGDGIISSIAATALMTTLGSGQPASLGTFDGETVSTHDVEVRYTYFGDANLDGQVDGSDYSLIDNGYLNQLTGFANGDFNYDGVIDGSDYTLIDNAFNRQGVALDDAIALPTTQIDVPGKASHSAAAISATSATAVPFTPGTSSLAEPVWSRSQVGLQPISTTPTVNGQSASLAVGPTATHSALYRNLARSSKHKRAAAFSVVELLLTGD